MAIKYDYIICGAGAAGLSLALRLADERFSHLKILLIDQSTKTGNDHTWCYWEKDQSPYDKLLTNAFENIHFHSRTVSKNISIGPYRYKMLQSEPFYAYVWKKINSNSHITFIQESVVSIEEEADMAVVRTTAHSYETEKVFTSIFKGEIDQSKNLYVAQHFKGWFIKSNQPIFEEKTATFMDFRIDQQGDCRFFYVLPTSPYEGLVEIAIFSNNVLPPEAYDPIIKDYLNTYYSIDYEVVEKEYGVIPMTTYPFWNHITKRVFPIGTAGGAVKPSSGFAFKRIQEHSDRIIKAIEKNTSIATSYDVFKNKFYLYDKVLLDVILLQNESGADIFSHLFGKNRAQDIFEFLDGKTSYIKEANIFKTLPLLPFLRGWFRQKIKI